MSWIIWTWLACYSPVAGRAWKPQVSASRTSEATRTENQCAKEQSSPHAGHHILGNESGLAINASVSLRNEYSPWSALSMLRVVILKWFRDCWGLWKQQRWCASLGFCIWDHFNYGKNPNLPSRPNMLPLWDLSLLLSALSEPPYEPLHTAELKCALIQDGTFTRFSMW